MIHLRILCTAMSVLLSSACSWGTDVRNAWVRLSAAPGEPATAYFDVTAESGGTIVLGLRGPFEQAELGDASDKPVQSIPLSSGEEVRLRPGGLHFKLFGLAPHVQPGSNLDMQLVDNDVHPESWVRFSARVISNTDQTPYQD